MSDMPISAPASALRTAVILLLYVVIFTGILAAANQWTLPAIEASRAAKKMKFINEVLPAEAYDNDLLTDTLTLPPTPELGLKQESLVYRARRDGQPSALVLEAVAPDGYAGDIHLILGITANGTITGVRVSEHKETPGLGDYVDSRKDRNKAHPWISQFDGLNYPQVPDAEWKVKKDRGRFDSHTGATISPRAVVAAVHRAAQFATTRKDDLFKEHVHDQP